MMSPTLSRELARIYNTYAADPRIAEVRTSIGRSRGRLNQLPASTVALLLEWGLSKHLLKEGKG